MLWTPGFLLEAEILGRGVLVFYLHFRKITLAAPRARWIREFESKETDGEVVKVVQGKDGAGLIQTRNTEDGSDLESVLAGRMHRVGEQLDVKDEGDILGCLPQAQTPSQGYNQRVVQDCSRVRAWLGRDPLLSSLTWLLAGLGYPPWLLPGTSVPCHLGPSSGQLTTW